MIQAYWREEDTVAMKEEAEKRGEGDLPGEGGEMAIQRESKKEGGRKTTLRIFEKATQNFIIFMPS